MIAAKGFLRTGLVAVVTWMAAACAQIPASSPTLDPAEFAPDEVEVVLPSPSPAIHASLWWDEGIAQRDMDLIADLPAFDWVKQKFAWRDIETLEKNAYDWWRSDRIVADAEARGLNLLVRLDRQPFWSQANGGWPPLENAPPADYRDFEDFCFAVADRYTGRIQAYQVWNEPNLAREWGEQPPNPEEYVRLLAHCARGIRNADPDAIIISAGLAPTGTGLPEAMPDEEFLRGMYEAGADRHFDMLGVNAPGYAAPPEIAPEVVANTPEYGGQHWASFRHVENIRRIMVEYDDAGKQMAILEMGWTTDPINPEYAWFAVTPEQQADYLRRAYLYAYEHWRPWISLMTTIFLPDPYWTEQDEQYWWGLAFPGTPEPTLRPAYDALRDLPDWHD